MESSSGVATVALSKRGNSDLQPGTSSEIVDFPDTPPVHPCSYTLNMARRLEGTGFQRFEWVTGDFLRAGDKLARASAPHYDCKDSNQELTYESVSFLRRNGITNVISLNEFADSPAMKKILKVNKIKYTPIPTADYKAPSLEELQKGYKSFNQATNGATMVWCGYGHGRTGIMISAIEMFREAEKMQPTRFSHSYLKRTNHIETKGQVRLLDKLQDMLQIGGAERRFMRGVSAWAQAKSSFDRIEKARSPVQKNRVRVDCRNKLAASTEALEEALITLDFHWNVNRVLFDRLLKTYAWRKKQNMPVEEQSLDIQNQIMQNVNSQIGQPNTENTLPRQTTIIEQALRATISDLESRRTDPKAPEVVSLNIGKQVDKIEEHRRIARSMYIELRKNVKNLQEETKDMLELVFDPEAIGMHKSTMRRAKAELVKLKEKALKADDMKVIYKCSEDALINLEKAQLAASAISQTIQNSKKLVVQDFSEPREILSDMRTGLAEIKAKEVTQFIRTYIVEKWKNLETLSTSRKDLVHEVNYLNELALLSHGNAVKLGEALQDKANNLNLIKNLMAHPKLARMQFDAATAVETTSAIWLKGKETSHYALYFERQCLESEIALTQGPINTYVTTALMIQKEAEITAAVLDNSLRAQDATQERLDWKREGLAHLIDSLRKEVQDERDEEERIRAANRKASLESAAALEELQKSQHWKIHLGIDIANAILAAVPSPAAPIADVMIWARQAIRIGRFLRNLLRRGEMPAQLVEETQVLTGNLHRSMDTWRTRVPRSIRDWASDKTPQQILGGLGQMRGESEEIEAELDAVERAGEAEHQATPGVEEQGTAGQVDHQVTPGVETAGQVDHPATSSVEEEQPPTSGEMGLFDKSIEEVIEHLETIDVPIEEPGDLELNVPMSKTLRKLIKNEVRVETSGERRPLAKVRVKEAPLRARRSLGLIRQDLQEAALIPHHTSDHAFKQLLDDAAWYLPDDCDLRPNSLGLCVIQEIREGAVAA
ncbi:hypothetical protein CDD82_355 [Ophiocordyceps australis]|uniref:Swiss Army Knife protein DSP-PTPase phosphatase domain-containing protein n=1 Tax=Ophiocordyceps australis TaxID=1399860 RepID=A0A2C5ZI10_9HYPO|nr:hypothetical protein CDD82_355 [Ophiocordyceps australis]